MSELVDTPSGLEILQLPPDGSVTEGILIDGDLFEIEPIFPDYYAAIALTFTNIATGEVLYQAQISAVSWRGWTLTAQVRSTLSRLASGTHRAMKRGTVQ
jgi:hypothetical protein